MNKWIKTIQHLLPQTQCVLCSAPAGNDGICAGCFADLPRLGPGCLRCAEPLAVDTGLCGRCQRQRPHFDITRAALRYEAPVDGLLHRFKYRRRLDLVPLLQRPLVSLLQAQRPRVDLLLAMPIHPTHLRVRGYNQALELAKGVAYELGLSLDLDGCQRITQGPAQRGLNAQQRRRNVRRAFRACRDYNGARIAVVDDVVTTGATADELAAALKRAGADWVEIWSLARAPYPG